MDSVMPVNASGCMRLVSVHRIPWYGPYVVLFMGPF